MMFDDKMGGVQDGTQNVYDVIIIRMAHYRIYLLSHFIYLIQYPQGFDDAEITWRTISHWSEDNYYASVTVYL